MSHTVQASSPVVVQVPEASRAFSGENRISTRNVAARYFSVALENIYAGPVNRLPVCRRDSSRGSGEVSYERPDVTA